ncbi:MAG: RNA 2',3'-cyclic phosphodiesterase, partial [Candidatus Limnocylindria bacterium]
RDDLRWTDPDSWHVTLAFLGEIEASSVPELVDRLGRVVDRHPAMSLRTGGLGAFPTSSRARVAWYGVEDPHGQLERLAPDVAVALDLDAPRLFRPHLTLARARRRPVDLTSWVASASAPAGALEIDRVTLVRSHLGPGPVRHETLATMRLKVLAGV